MTTSFLDEAEKSIYWRTTYVSRIRRDYDVFEHAASDTNGKQTRYSGLYTFNDERFHDGWHEMYWVIWVSKFGAWELNREANAFWRRKEARIWIGEIPWD